MLLSVPVSKVANGSDAYATLFNFLVSACEKGSIWEEDSQFPNVVEGSISVVDTISFSAVISACDTGCLGIRACEKRMPIYCHV